MQVHRRDSADETDPHAMQRGTVARGLRLGTMTTSLGKAPMRRLFLGLVALAIGAACSNSSGPNPPPPVPNSQLHIVLQDTAAPPLLADSASFYAVVGQDRELRMYYQGALPSDTGDEFLRFKVPGDGLLRRPDGSLFQPGDSILIIVNVVDATKFLFDFQPTGLRFSPDHPAELTFEYLNSN